MTALAPAPAPATDDSAPRTRPAPRAQHPRRDDHFSRVPRSGLTSPQDLAVDLGVAESEVLWIINAYTLALAALLMPVGAIGDKWGRKPVLLTGLAVFGVASLGARHLDHDDDRGPGARRAGAAMIMPVTLSVITSTFPPEDRARAIGIWAGFAGSGGIIGMFVSAFTVDVLTWRWSFVLPSLSSVWRR